MVRRSCTHFWRGTKRIERSWILATLGVLSLFFLYPAWGEEKPSLGPLIPFLLLEREGPWEGKMEGENYLLENSEDPQAVHYVPIPRETIHHSFTITVSGETKSPGLCGAGLLYSFKETPLLSYYALIVDNERGTVSLLRYEEGKFQELFAMGSERFRSGKHCLTIHEEPQEVIFSIDNEEIGRLKNDNLSQGMVGIIAIGIGAFSFSHFVMHP